MKQCRFLATLYCPSCCDKGKPSDKTDTCCIDCSVDCKGRCPKSIKMMQVPHKTKKLIMFGRYESKGNHYIKSVCLECEEKYIKKREPEIINRKVGTDQGRIGEVKIIEGNYLGSLK